MSVFPGFFFLILTTTTAAITRTTSPLPPKIIHVELLDSLGSSVGTAVVVRVGVVGEGVVMDGEGVGVTVGSDAGTGSLSSTTREAV